MLNLSDKELDRFSKEAAEEYDPGDVLGPRSWDKLEVRIHQEFGHQGGWNPLHHFRRFALYYAPALLALVGVTYYYMRPGVSSGSSPGRTVKAPTEKTPVLTQKPVSTDKITSTPATSSSATTSSTDRGQGSTAQPDINRAGNIPNVKAMAPAETPDAVSPAEAASARAANTASTPSGSTDASVANRASSASGNRHAATGNNRTNRSKNAKYAASHSMATAGGQEADERLSAAGSNNPGSINSPAGTNSASGITPQTSQRQELSLSSIQSPHSLKKRSPINDSALRAFTLKSSVPVQVRGRALHIDRNWQFGLLVAPDFTSVNSLAGDKPGSSIGVTVDYQFAPRWYVGSGILVSRKNYSAQAQDYHAPPSVFSRNNINMDKVRLVKGSFSMMEIPLNLRYDFSVTGSTLFFATVGTSSYLFTSENDCIFWNPFLRWQQAQPIPPPASSNYLFSTVNLSIGVETGISNSLSVLIAPYVKLPTQGIGTGNVQMNSVGINASLKWAPVTGRHRR